MMRKLIFLDCETSGFAPGQIAQLSYLIVEMDEHGTLNQITPKNYFFTVEEMSEGAEGIHGFSIEKLKILSDGLKFGDWYSDIFNDFNNTIMICHNVEFDKRFMVEEFKRCEVEFKPATFCTMEYFTDICKLSGKARNGNSYKYPKLSELMAFYMIPEETVLINSKQLFNSEDIGFHDARFDVVGMYMAFKMGLEQGYITKDLFKKYIK